MNIDLYWQKFKNESRVFDDPKYAGELSFHAHGITEPELLVLIMTGKKTAEMSAYASYSIDSEPLPVSGEIYIVTDHNENPCCIIEVTAVSILPYNEVTWPMAQKEGEDENFAQWHDRHNDLFNEDAKIMGYEFTPDINVIFQQFRVIYR